MMKNPAQREFMQKHAASLATQVAKRILRIEAGSQDAQDTVRLANDVAELVSSLATPV